MREFLFCTIPAGKEHCYTNKISGVHKDRKEAFPLICQQVVFSASAVLVFVILFVNLTDSLGLLFCAELNVIILAKRKYRAWS